MPPCCTDSGDGTSEGRPDRCVSPLRSVRYYTVIEAGASRKDFSLAKTHAPEFLVPCVIPENAKLPGFCLGSAF